MFTTEEGAGDHCQAGSPLLSAQRTFDWLQETSAAHPPPAPHKPPRQATSAAGARRHVPGQRSKTTRSCRCECARASANAAPMLPVQVPIHAAWPNNFRMLRGWTWLCRALPPHRSPA